MRRRELLLAGALAVCAFARAQPAGKVYRIGILESVPAAQNTANIAAFRQGLRELGYVEGRNLVIDYRSSDGRADRFPRLAAELVASKVDLIVARGTPATRAAKEATSATPVVMATMGDPRALAGAFARPGGNITGFTTFSTELSAKRIELLRELAPTMKRVALLHNMGNPAAPPEWEDTDTGARALGLGAELLDVRNEQALAQAFATAAQRHVDALIVGADGLMQLRRREIVALAARSRLPAAYPSREFVDEGGLLSYAVNYPALYARFASYVDKILKGARPADLPVEQPARFELVVNLRTANALGLTVPPSLLLRADDVLR